MTEASQTLDKKQVEAVIKRRSRYMTKWILSIALGMIVFVLAIYKLNFRMDRGLDVIFLILYCWLMVVLLIKAEKNFARTLSLDERKLMAGIPKDELTVTQIQTIETMLTTYENLQEKEYLRASHQTQNDGTLLRAATRGSETAQAELLRAVPSEEKPDEITQVTRQG